ncbi:MAG: flippase [Nanoarchaeota archaeon]
MYLQRVVRGISLSFVLIILGAFLAYVFRRTLALELSIEDYGLFYSLLSFFGFFMLFVDMGIEQATTKRIVELLQQKKKEQIPSVVMTILFGQLAVSVVFSLLFLLGTNFIAAYYFHNAHVTSFFFILIFWFLTTPLFTFCAYILLGFQRTTWYTALDAARMLIVVLISLIGFRYDVSLYVPVIAYALINIILFLVTYPYIISFFHEMRLFSVRIWKTINKTEGLGILHYSIPVAFTSFGWIIITQTDTIVLTYFTSLRDVGIYNIALPISLLLLFFMRPVIIVFAPLVTELATAQRFEKLTEALTLAYTYLFVLLLPFAVGMALFPEYIISLLFSEKYLAAVPALQLLSIGTLFYSFSLFNNIIYTGIGHATKIAKTVASLCVVNFFLTILFVGVFHWNIIGAALATTISYILLFITSTYGLAKQFSFSFPLKIWVLSIIFVSASALLLQIFKKILPWNNLAEALLCGTLFLLFYVFLLLITKTVQVQQIKNILARAVL